MSNFQLQPGMGRPSLTFGGAYPQPGHCDSPTCKVPIIINAPNQRFCKLCATARKKASVQKSDQKRKAAGKAHTSK